MRLLRLRVELEEACSLPNLKQLILLPNTFCRNFGPRPNPRLSVRILQLKNARLDVRVVEKGAQLFFALPASEPRPEFYPRSIERLEGRGSREIRRLSSRSLSIRIELAMKNTA